MSQPIIDNEKIDKAILNESDPKSMMTIKSSAINADMLQLYMQAVYGVTVNSIKPSTSFDRHMEEVLSREMLRLAVNDTNMRIVLGLKQIPKSIVKMDIAKGFAVSSDHCVLVKHCRSGLLPHLEEEGVEHPYVREASVLARLFNDSSVNMTVSIILMFTNAEDEEDKYAIHRTRVNVKAYGQFIAKMSLLQEAILSGQEPDRCAETWNGSKCQNYCDFGPNGLNICDKAHRNK